MEKNVISLIKVLRERTGAGMMDCKKALEENELDVEKAIDWLREKGIAKQAKKSSRIAAEGLALTSSCECCNKHIVLEINCETDFVAKGDNFKKLVLDTAEIIMKENCTTVEEAKEATTAVFTDAAVSMGEKLDLRRFEVIEGSEGNCVGSYVHMGGKIAVLVVLDGCNPELAKGLAMHIAANNPQYISKNDIPGDEIKREEAIQYELAKTDEKLASKPAEALAKIIEGKINKIMSESTLSEQTYLLDGATSVANVLKSKGLNVVKFVRYAVGEGIEKRKDDFASEVMNQVK